MDNVKIQSYLQLIKSIAQLLSLARLYPSGHPTVEAKSSEALFEIEKITSKDGSLIFSVQGSLIFLNGEKLELQDRLSKIFIDDFSKLKIGSLDLNPGLTLEELDTFISLLNNATKISGEEQVKAFLEEHKVKNIIPHFATYKLVQENEEVVKGEEVINIGGISTETIKNFSFDLKNSVIKNKTLAHNANFLSGVLTDMSQTINTPEEFLKIIWVMGEYLIDEVSALKEEQLNRKILEQLKSQLLSTYEKKDSKHEWRKHIEDSFVKIIAALELKGFVLRYRKHKNELETVSKKIKSLLDNIPQDSKLSQKIRDELKEIGIPDLDTDMFS